MRLNICLAFEMNSHNGSIDPNEATRLLKDILRVGKAHPAPGMSYFAILKPKSAFDNIADSFALLPRTFTLSAVVCFRISDRI